MELSDEKTLITHSNTYARFLGYDVRVWRDNRTITNGGTSGFTKRTLNNMTELAIPLQDKIMRFLFDRGAVVQKNGVIKPMHRKSLLCCTDLEIVSSYNAELRGMERHCNLCQALNSLPEVQGRRIEAHYLLGKSQAEIAEAEGVTKGSVSISITRGLAAMNFFIKNFDLQSNFCPQSEAGI